MMHRRQLQRGDQIFQVGQFFLKEKRAKGRTGAWNSYFRFPQKYLNSLQGQIENKRALRFSGY
jgi:hypothetical protein